MKYRRKSDCCVECSADIRVYYSFLHLGIMHEGYMSQEMFNDQWESIPAGPPFMDKATEEFIRKKVTVLCDGGALQGDEVLDWMNSVARSSTEEKPVKSPWPAASPIEEELDSYANDERPERRFYPKFQQLLRRAAAEMRRLRVGVQRYNDVRMSCQEYKNATKALRKQNESLTTRLAAAIQATLPESPDGH